MRQISKLNKRIPTPKLLVAKVRKLYAKRPTLVILCVAAGLLLAGTSAYAAYKVLSPTHSETVTTTRQETASKQQAGTASASNTNVPAGQKEPGENKDASSQKTADTSSPQSAPTTAKAPATSNQPSKAPVSNVPPYYGAILPATVVKTDNGATMTYTISMTIVPNETFGNPMIRLQLFHPSVCINNSELTRIYRYNSQNTLSMSCIIDKSKPAYGMTELNLDFSIYKDSGEAIYGEASGWVHVLPQNYNQ